jgi:hypothetical protein
MGRSKVRRVAIVVVALAWAGQALATVWIPTDLRQLVAAASVVVYGRVTDVKPGMASGRARIERTVTLVPAEYYKGRLGGEIQFIVPGGQLGRYRTVMIGAPDFAEGEDVVVFLAGDTRTAMHVVALSQGVFRVWPDVATGARLVIASIGGRGARAGVPARGGGRWRPEALESFAAEVRRLAAGQERVAEPR